MEEFVLRYFHFSCSTLLSSLSSHPGLDGSLCGIFPEGRLEVEPEAGLGSRFSGHKQAVVTDGAKLGEVSRGLELLQQLSQDVSTPLLQRN